MPPAPGQAGGAGWGRRDFVKAALASGFVSLWETPVDAAEVPPRVRTLVLGGGVFALGYVLAHPAETLLVTRSLHLGDDFACTIGPHDIGTPRSADGRRLAAALVEAGVVCEGVLDAPPLADFFATYFAAAGGRAFVCAEPVALTAMDGGFTAEICGGAGEIASLACTRVLDTTARGFAECGRADIVGCRFGGLGPEGPFAVDLPPESDWHTARNTLYAAWEAAGHAPEELLCEVNALAWRYRPGRIARSLGAGRAWVPSGQFASLLTAFEEGVSWNFA